MKVALSVLDFLQRAEQVYPDRVGVVDEPNQPAKPVETLSYGELGRYARALACGLDALNIPQGARIAVVSHNSARLLAALHAVPSYGRICVPINFRLHPSEVEYIVNHCGAEVLLVDPELADALGHIKVKHTFVIGEEADTALLRFDEQPKPWEPDEDATATINYTSGTTAMPKGVQITHRNIWINASTFGWHLGINDRDVYLHTLPMFHCNGWGILYSTAAMGCTQVVLRQVDGAEILRRVQQHGVTLMCGAPAVVNFILEAAENWDGEIPGRGKVRMVVAGAPPPTRTLERMETLLGWEPCQIYGLTETSPLLTINRPRSEWDHLSSGERARKMNRAGAPALGVRLRVDETDEICARSNVVMDGYWEQPEATADAIRDGWFHTGDGGIIDEDNYLNIQDRKKDVIVSGGENVSSIEVEDVLFTHSAVSEVAVIGVPHDKWGETVKALVVCTQEVGERELIDYCRERLTHYKCPTSIEFRDELSRTSTGKLQKYKLRAPYWKDRERQVN